MNVFNYFFENTKNLDKDFVIGNKETISYKNLYQNSLKIASYINETIGVNNNIIVVSQNSTFFITVYLGILKSGNVCVPLDFSIEQENLEYISDISESTTIFSDKKSLLKLDYKGFKEVIDEDKFVKIFKDQNSIDFDKIFDSQKLAEIIFTSGSTGKPKGVMISHQNIIANTNSIIEYLKLTSDDISLVVLPFYYCFGLSLLHTHLRVGGSIVINNTFMFLGTVVNDLKNFKCTSFSGVPSHYQILLKKSKSFVNTSFPDLNFVTQAGGKLHTIFIEEFIEVFPNVNFITMYGQTEATARLSFLPPNKVMNKLGSIGKPIPGVQLKIINKEGDIIESEVEGELIARGDNIMRGYYKDEIETSKVLKNGWLYTGDIAKRDKEGFLYLVARKKEIIKVNGKRVSPKEIEEVILSVPMVVDCTIKGVYDDIFGEALEALVVIDKMVLKDEIKSTILMKCKQKLALHKIPQNFKFEYSLKVKPTGKKVIL